MRTAGLFAALAASAAVANAATDPDVLIRKLMTDQRFVGIVSPCSRGGTNRENAAEWLRTSFHDAVAHDAAAGTGGIDGSVQYEVGYNENRGVQINSVVTQYKFYRPEGVSLADIIVLGAIASVGSCGGPIIDFYTGRTDAPAASPEGIVPAPEQSTESHIETFAKMGMSKTDMISLIACGHTLGGVHANINAPLTSQAYHHFDDSHAAFDNNIAIHHMNGSTQNPLGQPYDASNPGTSSDSRIFNSDGNVTIKAYADSNEAFKAGCDAVFSKMFNKAIPASVSLRGPWTPFPVTVSFRTSYRNGALSLLTGNARLYDMVGQWSKFEVGFTNRDGSIGSGLLNVRDVTDISIGKPVQVRTFTTGTVVPATGISSVFVSVTMNDGSIFKRAEGAEVALVQDTILIDVGPTYTCKYSGVANDNGTGLNVTMAVLGPYNAADKVELILRTNSGDRTFRASFRAVRDQTYNLYNVFVADIASLGVSYYSAQVTKADGTFAQDTRGDDTFYGVSTLSSCVAGAEVPTPAPVPSTAITRRNNDAARKRLEEAACPRGFLLCDNRCAHTASDIEHCGGCAGAGGVDCTTLSNGAISCIEGKCVAGPQPSY